MTADQSTTSTPAETGPHARRRLRLGRALVVVPVLAVAAFAAPALVPTDAAVPQVLKVAQAQASPFDCYALANRTFAVTRGDFPAAITAMRATGGCGDSIADGMCSASHQWWGGWARAMVRFITGGRYSSC